MSWSLYDPNPEPEPKNVAQIVTLLGSIVLTLIVIVLCS